MHGEHVLDKLSRGLAGAEGQCTGTRKLSRNCESCERSSTEIRVEYASSAISNDVDGTNNWMRSHRQARRKRFKQDEAKGVGQTWEHEYVGTCIGSSKPLVAHFADEMCSIKSF